MKSPGYFLVRSISLFLGLFPLWFLFIIFDLLYYFAFYIIRYRRKVVRRNLINSFPEKPLKEIKSIEKKFYHNFMDLFAENVKMTRMSKAAIKHRVRCENPDFLAELAKAGKSVFLATGHFGNWEWVGKAIPLLTNHRCIAIFKRLSNKSFDALIAEIRINHNNQMLLESRLAYKGLRQLSDRPNAVGIVADQSPSGNDQDYWTQFLHQETAFFNGPEKMAKALNYAVLYVEVTRPKRGYYSIRFSPITLDPSQAAPNEITEKYARMLERAIVASPSNWLWSHRRWKHQRTKTNTDA